MYLVRAGLALTIGKPARAETRGALWDLRGKPPLAVAHSLVRTAHDIVDLVHILHHVRHVVREVLHLVDVCLLYTSDAADE